MCIFLNVGGMEKLEVSTRCALILFSALFSGISSPLEGGSHQLCQSSWFSSPTEPPVSAYGVLGLQGHSEGTNNVCECLELNSGPHDCTARTISTKPSA